MRLRDSRVRSRGNEATARRARRPSVNSSSYQSPNFFHSALSSRGGNKTKRVGFCNKTFSFSFHRLIFGEASRDRCGMRALRKTLKAVPRIFNVMGPDKAAATGRNGRINTRLIFKSFNKAVGGGQNRRCLVSQSFPLAHSCTRFSSFSRRRKEPGLVGLNASGRKNSSREMQLVLMGERRRGRRGEKMMFRTLCSVSLTALFAIYGLHLSHDLFPFIFFPTVSSSASLRLIGFRTHTSQSSRHFIYSIHAFNEWSNHGAIKCKRPLRIV